MKKGLMTTILVLVVVLVTSCIESPSSITTPAGEEVNFRLWISDEANAIDDFDELWVTITQVGVQQGGESGVWIEHYLDPEEKVDLTELKGDNATEIWSGELNDGTYTKVFIYVSDVKGVLADGEVNVKLPSGKLQISKPFEVTSGEVTEFVYDITVIKAGKSGKYTLKPQIVQSGPDKPFNDIAPEGKGKPEDKGKPEGEEAGQDTTPPVIDLTGVIESDVIVSPDTVIPVFNASDETDPEPILIATLNGEPFTSGTVVSEVGEYELEVTAIDASDNEAEVAVNFEIVAE